MRFPVYLLFTVVRSFSKVCSSSSHISNGSSTVIFVPTLTILSTSIVPFITSTRFLTIAIPSPVPSTLSDNTVSSRSNGLNTRFTKSSLIPIPSSITTNFILHLLSSHPSSITSSDIFPKDCVYFTAFDNRFVSICLTLSSSIFTLRCCTLS